MKVCDRCAQPYDPTKCVEACLTFRNVDKQKPSQEVDWCPGCVHEIYDLVQKFKKPVATFVIRPLPASSEGDQCGEL